MPVKSDVWGFAQVINGENAGTRASEECSQ
jgi:hypothetical protein